MNKKFAALVFSISLGLSNVASAYDYSAITSALNSSQYSQQFNQLKGASSQYQSYMDKYTQYNKEYENLVKEYKAMGSPANLQASFMAEATRLSQGAMENYAAASQLTGTINSAYSSLASGMSSSFNTSSAASSLTSAASSIGSAVSSLSAVSSQLASLKSMASGNYSLTTQISGLEKYVSNISGQLSGMTGNININLNSITQGMDASKITSSLSGLTSQMSSITGMVSGLTSQVSNLASSATGAISGAMNSAISSMTSSLSGVASSLGGASSGIGSAMAGMSGSNSGLNSALKSATGMTGEYGDFGGQDGQGSGGFKQSEMQANDIEGDFAASETEETAGEEEEPVEEAYEGLFPDNDPDVYCIKDDECHNMKPTCDETGGVYGKVPITIGGCANSAYQIDYMQGEMSKNYFIKTTKQQDSKAAMDGKEVGFKPTAADGKSDPPTFGNSYPGISNQPKTYVNNWGKATGNALLIKRDDLNSEIPDDFGAAGIYSKEEKKKTYEYNKGGEAKQRKVFTTVYKDDEDALKKGSCQMIALKDGGEYSVKPAAGGNFDIAEKGAEGAMSVVPERIVDSSHPYSPRHKDEWEEKQLISGGSTTQNCGKDDLNGQKAWENGGSTDIGEAGDSIPAGTDMGLADQDYEYYKLPIDKGGKILSTNTRVAIYDALWVVLEEYIGDDAATYISCRVAILPPVTPTNYLKMSYNEQKKIQDMPRIYTVSGDDFGYPDTTGSNVDSWADGYIGLGTSWDQILPHDKFGYNMPPLKNWPTGKPASRPIIEETDDYPGKESPEEFETEDWEYWRTVITGVNSRFKPDESNPEEIGVFKFGCMYGEWNELVMYQANCNRFFGLNCICDYFKNFWRGSAIGYAMHRTSGFPAMQNEVKTETTQIDTENVQSTYDKFKYNKNVDISDVKNWERHLEVKEGNHAFPALLGKKVRGKKGEDKASAENFPGKGSFNVAGLDNAERGDIIIWDSQEASEGGHKRPLHAAYVERKTEKDGNVCIEISESNNGVIRDSCENTENWGRVTQRTLCKNDDQNYTFNQDGKKGLKSCAYTQMAKCWEKDWDKWKIYKYNLDN